MSLKLFSDRKRPVHLGPYPLDRLKRMPGPDADPDNALDADPGTLSDWAPLEFGAAPRDSLIGAMAEHQAMMDAARRAMMDAVRDGLVAQRRSTIPADPQERANHMKAFGYFSDASMVGCCALPDAARLDTPVVHPGIAALAEALRTRQTKNLASGIDVIMADLRESMMAPPSSVAAHGSALVILVEFPRDPKADESGCRGGPPRPIPPRAPTSI